MNLTQKKLLRLFADLDHSQQEMLLAFAEFLQQRAACAITTITAPLAIPRPPVESVIAAIKRLTATYPMLERARLFNESSILMSAHIMGGRPAVEVIDELELLFTRQFSQWCIEQQAPQEASST